jgi:uncharacterized damage-inducible protein DinB
MTEKEFFVETVKDETPRFVRVFMALPMAKLGHTHHPKSKTASQLAVQMADEALSFNDFLTKGEVDWSARGVIEADTEVVSQTFTKGMQAVQEIVRKMSEADWASECRALYNGKEVWKTTKGSMAWGLLFDLIHHRGQLSTYIRPMGGKVPSIYGPSGDMAE